MPKMAKRSEIKEYIKPKRLSVKSQKELKQGNTECLRITVKLTY